MAAIMGGERESIDKMVENYFEQNIAYIWEDEVAVSILFGAASNKNSRCIGPVYTPPESRQQGYATSGVAQLTQKFLQADNQFCCLFRNLANPTSNKIYRQIAYLPVADWNDYNCKN
ncbi:hypothetical protein RintRC_3181 [Richelia intracellularis]|nr:hypothetical protein RintRC_3181 [Richelia intracellularis]